MTSGFQPGRAQMCTEHLGDGLAGKGNRSTSFIPLPEPPELEGSAEDPVQSPHLRSGKRKPREGQEPAPSFRLVSGRSRRPLASFASLHNRLSPFIKAFLSICSEVRTRPSAGRESKSIRGVMVKKKLLVLYQAFSSSLPPKHPHIRY